MTRSASVVALLLVAGAGACLPGRGLPGTDSPSPQVSDSVAILVDNRNYLSATVRLFSRGSQVRRLSVTGLQSDTVFLRRSELRVPGQIAAVIELVGSREAYRLPEELFPSDASLIEIHVAQLLRSSSLAVY